LCDLCKKYLFFYVIYYAKHITIYKLIGICPADSANDFKKDVPFFLLVRYIGKNLKFGRIIIGGIDEKIKCCGYF